MKGVSASPLQPLAEAVAQEDRDGIEREREGEKHEACGGGVRWKSLPGREIQLKAWIGDREPVEQPPERYEGEDSLVIELRGGTR